jgi:hypothetical protein
MIATDYHGAKPPYLYRDQDEKQWKYPNGKNTNPSKLPWQSWKTSMSLINDPVYFVFPLSSDFNSNQMNAVAQPKINSLQDGFYISGRFLKDLVTKSKVYYGKNFNIKGCFFNHPLHFSHPLT